ncbi:peptide-methionine (S)-S-oxide reductase MsrA [Alkaliflexus imshenetskii]|uniref:peptide-methionine (S)-S-oxide reductase MsrA n=1 Tax=Alkaliflexus imshenetskii TaxID=286730 RepID=UPI00047C7DC2|nr:peptide-methionine (S)-S-oxide reductase MsrA [Alkaliflexus imshenetskii]
MANERKETAVLGGGCFWCLEAVYQKVRGVHEVVSGYSGGTIKNPAYREVTTGRTGHAEVVKITFNPDVISYEIILSIFFTIHDPTTLNRQGADVGTQYRSVIFYQDEKQKETALQLMKSISEEKVFANPLVTQLVASAPFYVAEEYHQNYYSRNQEQPYCQVVISPKINKFRSRFSEWLNK